MKSAGRKRFSSPRRHFVHFLKDLAIVIAIALLIHLLEFHGWLATAEGIVLDLFQSDLLRHPSGGPKGESPIVTIEIDDASYRDCFESTSPLKPAVVADLIGQATSAVPAIIGVDILTDSPQYIEDYRHWDFAGWDSKIVWVMGTAGPSLKAESFWDWLTGHTDLVVQPTLVLGRQGDLKNPMAEPTQGFPVFPRDEDLHLRRLLRQIQASSDPEHSPHSVSEWSFASAVAKRYCDSRPDQCRKKRREADEVFVSYRSSGPQRFEMRDLFRCSELNGLERGAALAAPLKPGLLWDKFKLTVSNHNKIILIGGTFRESRDFYETPVGRLPGLIVNAYAIQAEIDGTGVSELPRYWTFLGDLFLGWLLGYRVSKAHTIRRGILWSAGMILVAAFISFGAFQWGYIWVSCIGVVAGIQIHLIIEIWRLNPKMPRPHEVAPHEPE